MFFLHFYMSYSIYVESAWAAQRGLRSLIMQAWGGRYVCGSTWPQFKYHRIICRVSPLSTGGSNTALKNKYSPTFSPLNFFSGNLQSQRELPLAIFFRSVSPQPSPGWPSTVAVISKNISLYILTITVLLWWHRMVFLQPSESWYFLLKVVSSVVRSNQHVITSLTQWSNGYWPLDFKGLSSEN